MGDSLSAAYGLAPEQGWVALLKQKLEQKGFSHSVVNASISGETTAGGLARLPDLLKRHQPSLVLIELGGNDGLRGLSLKAMRENLRQMVRLSRTRSAQVLLFEMRIPSNYGPAFASAFQNSFSQVAADESVPLVPFFLAEIAEDESNFLPDGIHPNGAAQPKMLNAVWPLLAPRLKAIASKAAAAS